MIRYLITGGSSYLGQHLVPLASQKQQTGFTYFANNPLPYVAAYKLDVRDRSAVQHLVQELQPQVIIHTVGSNRAEDMANVITRGTRNVAEAAEEASARLIHISTDVVFNGQDGPYSEEAPPTPRHDYGRAKAEAELIVQKHPDHVIVRTSLIYGLQTMDRGTAWIVDALNAGQPVTLFTDQLRNPVWAETLCQACLELAENEYQGVLNVAGEQVLSRAEFGRRLLDWWGIEERSTLKEGASDPNIWPADCTLDLSRAREVLSTSLLGLDAVLEQNNRQRAIF